jgi:hypothetical protein
MLHSNGSHAGFETDVPTVGGGGGSTVPVAPPTGPTKDGPMQVKFLQAATINVNGQSRVVHEGDVLDRPDPEATNWNEAGLVRPWVKSEPRSWLERSDDAASALRDVHRTTDEVARCVEVLEAAYAGEEGPLNPAYFYVGCHTHGQRILLNGEDNPGVPWKEQPPRRRAMDATLAFRVAIDDAIPKVEALSPELDSPSESYDRRWSARVIGDLRALRGAVLRGHVPDLFPSALPMPRAGVPSALREGLRPIMNAIELVKTARVAKRTAPSLTKASEPVPSPPVGAEALDEYDVALLEFLNRTPTLRRKIADVLPERGPQDRKAVGRRLRKLADRTPPLVDYPRHGRSGVVILPAGVEAMKRATAPTPR